MQDVLLDSDYDLLFAAGDLVPGESTEQHQACLLRTTRGQLFFAPEVGVGIERFLKDEDAAPQLYGEIKEQFEKDGMQNLNISLEGTQLITNGNYKETSNAG